MNPLSLFNTESEDNARALLRMAETDPDKMLAWTRQLPEDKWHRGVLQGLAAQLAKSDPDQALAWAKSIKDPAKSAAAVAAVAGALGKSSPERALSLAAGLSQASDFDSRGNLYNAFAEVEVKDAATVEALAKGMPEGEARKRFVRTSVMKLLGSDPASAFALLERLGEGAGERWSPFSFPAAARTPEGARRILEAAEGAKDSVDRESAAKASLVSWMEKDPVSLAAYLKEKGDTPLLASMKENLQNALATQKRRDGQADPGLVALVGLPPEASVKSQMWEDPASAARGLEAVEDPVVRSRLAAEVAKSYVREDRTQAMVWAQSATDPEVRAAAWKAIAADWVGEDSWQASQWIAKLPEGKGRDSAVLAMTEGINKTDPDLAWQWALSMGDPDLKNQALAAAAQEWSRKDASALQRALSEGTLTPAQRQAVLEKLNPPSGKAP